MAQRDSRVDEYIEKAKDFAKPVLIRLRELIHKADGRIEETIKWGFPNFEYKGIVCSIASFKQHCVLSFHKASIMKDPHKILNPVGETAMGHFGQIKSLDDLPADQILLEYIQEAIRLNEQGVKPPVKTKSGTPQKTLQVPGYLLDALERNAAAKDVFENFSPSHKREYVEWLEEAKTEATREKRLQTAIEWMTEGKIRNWKYVKK